ncbi:hypothetical protein RDV89_00905 [Nocardioides zeae]|uniref:Restriction endonuclease n=1 Tax=Nocardioides imazamoxiresistens TaxID=3231893 RepID=A0ABU3PQU5_9ACTN|nr:hypothetical protein [Nocardioides zeae]MDT9591605.1 hypothetical protein [Nocardioides zeae]
MTLRDLYFNDDASAVLPGAQNALAELRARGSTHRYVRHVRSSQAFALNLFAPLNHIARSELLELLGLGMVSHPDAVAFEWEDELDRLAEASPCSPHRTQVDVLIRGTTNDGRRVGALIEVKLGEHDFGACSAYDSNTNPDRTPCRTPGLFGDAPDKCFQLNNHGRGRRTYDRYLGDVPISTPSTRATDGGCVVRQGRSQPMRNLALAHMLVSEGELDAAVFALCAPEKHPTIWRRFEEFQTVFGDTSRVRTARLPAEVVAAHHPDVGTALRRRYEPALVSFDAVRSCHARAART